MGLERTGAAEEGVLEVGVFELLDRMRHVILTSNERRLEINTMREGGEEEQGRRAHLPLDIVVAPDGDLAADLSRDRGEHELNKEVREGDRGVVAVEEQEKGREDGLPRAQRSRARAWSGPHGSSLNSDFESAYNL